jgi:hypothetical protein
MSTSDLNVVNGMPWSCSRDAGAHRLSCYYCIPSVKCQYRSFATDSCLLFVIVLTLDIVQCGIRTVSSNEPTAKNFTKLQSLVQGLCESNWAFPFVAVCIKSRSLKINYNWIHLQMSVLIADWIIFTIFGVLSDGYCHPSPFAGCTFAVSQIREDATRIKSYHSGPPVGRSIKIIRHFEQVFEPCRMMFRELKGKR